LTAMAGAAGQLIGERYRLVDTVGKGGMGQVWSGYDRVLEREVAIKEVLLPSALPEDQRDYTIARTMREARAAARLHHPGIVAVYDAVEHDGVPWIVMEFIAGLSLQQVIARDGRLPWQRVAALGVDLAAALAHAHAAQVVHRDLKPANVLLAGHRAVLTDFGVARVLDATTQLTGRGTLIGTPQYMPPEQIEGESVQAPVDLWALGATLYTAVEGSPPFEGTTLTSVLAAILTRPPREPMHAGPMAAALMSLMSKAPEGRPDAAELSRQLSALLHYGRPVPPVRSPSGAPPSPATVTLNRPGTFLETAVLDGHSGRVHSVAFSPHGITLATGCDQGVGPDGSLVSGGHRVRLWDVATRTCTAALAGPEGAALSVAFSPDGALLASGNSNQPVHLWRLTRRFRSNETTFGTDSNVLSVAFSPDGRTLATANYYKTVRLWDVPTRTCLATLTGHSGWVHSVAFSPDGTMLATGSSDHTVRLWDMRIRTCLATLTGHSEIVREVTFSPDGALLASGSVDKTIRLWDTRTRTCVATIGDNLSSVFSVAFSPDGALLASGGSDHAVRLWDAVTRACLATLTGHSEPVASVAFTPDGTTLASGGHDKTVRLWQLR
jgi:serine/threonine protein kinase